MMAGSEREVPMRFQSGSNEVPMEIRGKKVAKRRIMNSFYTILLLVASNVFMTLAWYGHLKMAEFSWFKALPLIGVIAISWGIALFEYCLQVPANRIGFEGNGGPFSLMQLKILQEVITLVVFVVFSAIAFHMQIKWNHIVAALCLVGAVYFVFGFK